MRTITGIDEFCIKCGEDDGELVETDEGTVCLECYEEVNTDPDLVLMADMDWVIA